MADKPKAILRHCQDVYTAMSSQAKPYSENPEFNLYTGYLTRLITEELALPNSYYTFVTKELLRMDCIRNIQRGGGSSPSQWILLKYPTQADFESMPELAPKLTKKQAVQAQFERNTLERLDRIERQLGIVSGPTE